MSAIQCFDGTILYSNVRTSMVSNKRRESISFSKQCNILSFQIIVPSVQKGDEVPKLIIPVPNGSSLKMFSKTPSHKKGIVATSWNKIEIFKSVPASYRSCLSHIPFPLDTYGCIVLYPKIGMHTYEKVSYIHNAIPNKVYIPVTHRRGSKKVSSTWCFNNKIAISFGKVKKRENILLEGPLPNKDIVYEWNKKS